MQQNGNVIIFDNDDEITDYCLNTEATIYPQEINGKLYYGYDYDFTDAYNKAIEHGIMFQINDSNSNVMKHGCVNRGIITKKLCNLIND